MNNESIYVCIMKVFKFYFKRDHININDFSISELHNSVRSLQSFICITAGRNIHLKFHASPI